ncbi:efflux RND transporter periplasmic adaptor subunit [Polymorphobacter fuscus]|nr:efflux RND transporter periplasmic adaptor subunit [Polymorphobacter fuscus]NJC07781.1 multidrug efflux system membrane fusion protein [Polymorphobacter fuscus]
MSVTSRPRSVLAVIGAALALGSCGEGDDAGARKRPPQVVGAMPAKAEDFAPRLVALGTVTPLQSVAVRPRSDGEIVRILFREGDDVRAGQPLFQLDDRGARAALAQARANLASARAAAVQARGDYTRAQQLVGKGFVSAAVLDQRKALAGSADAAIAAAQAAVQAAETALDFQTIRAPVSGRTGELGFRLGANVRTGEAVPLVTVNQLSPISVRFLVPPEQVQDVRGALSRGGVTVTARPQDDSGGAAPIATGRLSFLDNNVNPGTGSVAAKAEFVNKGDTLWPGAIINVEVPLSGSAPRIALPEGAVQTGRDAPFVWAVGADNKIMMRDVTVAGRANGKVFLASGVAPGETIIVDSLTKLRPGDTVRTRAGGAAPRTVAAAATGTGG